MASPAPAIHSPDNPRFRQWQHYVRWPERPDCPWIAVEGLKLADELAREFGRESATVAALLDDLEQLGGRLEETLWEHGGLPGAGLRAGATWRWRCLRRKLPWRKLVASLAKQVQAMPEPAAEWLRDLFQGLAVNRSSP